MSLIMSPIVSAIIRICLDILDVRVTNFGFTVIPNFSFRKESNHRCNWQKRRRIDKHVWEDGVADGLSPKWLLPSSAVLLSPASPDRKLLPLCCSSSSNACSAFKKIFQSNVPLLQKEGQGAPEERAVQEGSILAGDVNVHTIYRSKE